MAKLRKALLLLKGYPANHFTYFQSNDSDPVDIIRGFSDNSDELTSVFQYEACMSHF